MSFARCGGDTFAFLDFLVGYLPMRTRSRLAAGFSTLLILVAPLAGCAKMKQNDPQEDEKAQAQAKRQKMACGSPATSDRLKGLLFDQAISQNGGDRSNLDTLADYSLLRMEQPVVESWDPALDITRCKSRLILLVPPGAERAFAGQRQLQADVTYTAQAAADGSGFVYEVKGAERIVGRLAAFELSGQTFRPPAAIDEQAAETPAPKSETIASADVPPSLTRPVSAPSSPDDLDTPRMPVPERSATVRREAGAFRPEQRRPSPVSSDGSTGEATVRSFYAALGAGNGVAASAHMIPEKRSSPAFTPQAISRFYGKLPEPLRLTGITPLSQNAYRVTYRYSAGRSHCNGSAVVSVTRRNDRNFIRSIRASNGC